MPYHLWYDHARISFNRPKIVRPDHYFIPKFGWAELFSPGLSGQNIMNSFNTLRETLGETILSATVYAVHLRGGSVENLASIAKLKLHQHYLESRVTACIMNSSCINSITLFAKLKCPPMCTTSRFTKLIVRQIYRVYGIFWGRRASAGTPSLIISKIIEYM